MIRFCFLCLLSSILACDFCAADDGRQKTNADEQPRPASPRPASPADSLKQVHVPNGYVVELVVSEPLVKDPVAIDWDTQGRLWVVEMADYPLGMDGEGSAGGRVRVVEDTDGDGQYDSSTLFADGLLFPTGILVWGKGILVTAAPEILYLEDSDGDGKADVRKALFTGFLEGNQQLRVNGLRLGLDNWVHCASGSHHSGYGKGNRISSSITGKDIRIGSRDFRVQPDSGEIDPESGPSQYGRNRDDWGNWFGVQNSRPLWHYVLADRDIRRNPSFAPPDPKHQVVTPINPPVYPSAKLQKRFHSFEQSGRFTSACSGMIYRDDLLFDRKENEQHAFTCEPFHNLVQHNILMDEGVSFGFRRDPAEKERDFFTSEDRWCRPVMARTGPDGALWVVDMYRYMIEHPQWLPQEGKDELRPYYRHGENEGRIYRVVPADHAARETSWDDLSSVSLVDRLAHSNGWQRDRAQRLLVKRDDKAVIEPLRQMAMTHPLPLARLHALCTLDGMQVMPPDVIPNALHDTHPGVRRNAARLAETYPTEIRHLVPLVDDSDAKVRLQLAATLGSYDDDQASVALSDLATANASDDYIIANVMSSMNSRNIAPVIASVLRRNSQQAKLSKDRIALQLKFLTQLAALADAEAIGRIVEFVGGESDHEFVSWQFAGLAEILDGISKRSFSLDALSPEQNLKVSQTIAAARDVVAPENVEDGKLTPLIASALPLMLRQKDQHASDRTMMAALLVPQSSLELQLAVIDRFSADADRNVPDLLLDGWESHGPVVRAKVLDVLVSRQSWSHALLESVKGGDVPTAAISPAVRDRLIATKAKPIRDAWTKLFSATLVSDRKQLVESYRSALTLEGDVDRGAKLFEKNCAACHRLGKIGHDVGPNLVSITDKRPETLLAAMLDPSAAVEAKYVTYIVLTDDGRILNGLLSTETGSSITLLMGDGKKATILRTEVEQLRASGKSLMPDGLEKDLDPQAIADLIALLRKP